MVYCHLDGHERSWSRFIKRLYEGVDPIVIVRRFINRSLLEIGVKLLVGKCVCTFIILAIQSLNSSRIEEIIAYHQFPFTFSDS